MRCARAAGTLTYVGVLAAIALVGSLFLVIGNLAGLALLVVALLLPEPGGRSPSAARSVVVRTLLCGAALVVGAGLMLLLVAVTEPIDHVANVAAGPALWIASSLGAASAAVGCAVTITIEARDRRGRARA